MGTRLSLFRRQHDGFQTGKLRHWRGFQGKNVWKCAPNGVLHISLKAQIKQCHPERSEGSRHDKILRFAQDDMVFFKSKRN